MQRLKHSFLLVFICSILFSQHRGDSVVRQGVDAFFNYEYEKSIEILSNARVEFYEHPVVHTVWAAAWYQFDQSQFSADTVYSKFETRLNEIEQIYESLLTKYPENAEYLLYLGTAQSLRARIYLGQKRFVSTFYAAYQGFRTIQRANKGSQGVKDIYLPIGVIEWYSGLSNPVVQIAAQTLGVDPSRTNGIEKMEIAANESSWAWMEAMSILSVVYQFFDLNEKRGLFVSRSIAEKYPKNYDYTIYYTLGLLQNGMLDQANANLKLLDETLSIQRSYHQKRYEPYVNYLWGYYHFLKSDEKSALKFLELCIENYNSDLDIMLSSALLLKGNILDIQNKRQDAKRAYRACIRLKNHTVAISLAKQYLNEPFKG